MPRVAVHNEAHRATLTEQSVAMHLQVCCERTLATMEEMYGPFIERWLGNLELALQHAGSNTETVELMGAQKLIKLRAYDWRKQYLDNVQKGFSLFQKGSLQNDLNFDLDDDELSIVDNDSLDQRLVVTRVIHRLDVELVAQIWSLNQRLAILHRGQHVDNANSPIAPLRLYRVLFDVLQSAELEPSVQLEAVRAFGNVLRKTFGPLTTELNQYLVQAGVLPNLKYQPNASSSGVASKSQSSKASQEKQGALMEAISKLQSGASSGSADHNEPPIQLGELIDALSKVQQKEIDENSEVSPDETLQALLDALNQKAGDSAKENVSKLSEENTRIIDLVGMVFEYILKDKSLPAIVKTWLSYLHTPFLKLAFSDETFLDRSDHPARGLLNVLTEAGNRWVSNDGTAQFDMDNRIKLAVNRLLGKRINRKLIAETYREFSEYATSVKRKQALFERRAMEKMEGVNRLNQTKRPVFNEVTQRTLGSPMSRTAFLFLLQPWSDYLSFVFLRHGEKSRYWHDALNVVDDLIWMLQEKEGSEDLDEQKALFSALIKQIRLGLDAIGFDERKGKALVSALVMDMSKIQKGLMYVVLDDTSRKKLQTLAAQKVGIHYTNDQVLSDAEQKFVDNLSMIEFGTWFEFDGGKRLKVAWYNAQSSQYLFVDQMGRQERLMTQLELARLMLNKKATIIAGSSKPFFERALENIYQKLQADVSEAVDSNRLVKTAGQTGD